MGTPFAVVRVLALLLLAVPLSAQPVLEDGPPHPTGGQRGLMAVTGIAAGVGAVVLAADAVNGSDRTSVALVVAAYPLGVAAGVTLAGRALGLEVEFGTALVDAAISLPVAAGAGLVAGTVVAAAVWVPTAGVEYNFFPALAGGAVAVIVASTVPAVWAIRHVSARPATFTAPSGDGGHGLTLAVSL